MIVCYRLNCAPASLLLITCAGRSATAGVHQRVHAMRREELEDLFLKAHDENLALKRQARAYEDERKT